jgi:hypothetical protein
MRTYKIPVSWQEFGFCNVQADSIAEAIEKALDSELPRGSYVCDSQTVDLDVIEEHNENLSLADTDYLGTIDEYGVQKKLVCRYCGLNLITDPDGSTGVLVHVDVNGVPRPDEDRDHVGVPEEE